MSVNLGRGDGAISIKQSSNSFTPKLLSADPALQLSVDLRNRTIVPLGFLQVALLKRLRDQNRQPPISEDFSVDSTRSPRTYSRSELLRGALLTINGIAAGMRNTG